MKQGFGITYFGEKERTIFNPILSLISSIADLGDYNNSGSMVCMLSTQYELICFIVSIKFVFCNLFIGSFDY